MKCFKILQFSIDFSPSLLIFSLASGGSAPPPNPLQIYISKIFPKFLRKCRETFKKFSKNRKLTCKFSKHYKIFIDFLTFFSKIFEFEKMRNVCFLQCKKVPTQACRDPPPIREILYKLLTRLCLEECSCVASWSMPNVPHQ